MENDLEMICLICAPIMLFLTWIMWLLEDFGYCVLFSAGAFVSTFILLGLR
jgi:hypothetical protein